MTGNRASEELSRAAAWGILVGLVALGVVLRVISLDSGLWYDEIKTLLESVRDPLGEIVTRFPGNNDHMLLSVLSRVSIVTFGEHAWSVRLPAVLFGVAAIPALYWLGTAITSRLEAILAALLLTVSYHHVWFSQNARGYTALLFCALLATTLLLKGLEGDGLRAWVGYGLAAAVGSYAHLTMVLVVLTQAAVVGVHLLVRSGGRVPLERLVGPAVGFGLGGLATIALYAPVMLEVREFFTQTPQPAAARVATAGWAFQALIDGLRVGFATGWGLAAGAVVGIAGVVSTFRRSPTVCALLVLPGPVTLTIAILLERPTFPRFFFFMAGFALLIVVRGAAAIGAWLAGLRPDSPLFGRLRVAAPVLMAVALTVQSFTSLPYGYRYPKQDYAGAAHFVEDRAASGDRVAVVGGGAAIPYQLYFEKSWPKIESPAQLDAVRDAPGTVWLLFTFQSYIESREPELFAAVTDHCNPEKSFHGTVAGGDIAVYRCGGS